MYLLTYSFLQDSQAFPATVMNPLDYCMEAFDSRVDALRKARYVVSHSRVYNLKIHELEVEMSDSAVRAWIGKNPDSSLDFASEAGDATSPVVSQSDS